MLSTFAGPHLRAVEQLEQEALVGRPVAKHDHRLAQRAPQPRQRLVAIAPPGDQLRDHRVELGGDLVALGDARVHPQPGAGRQPQQLHPPRRGREVERRVLGVQARLDRVAVAGGRLALEPPAGGDVELELDQVDAR